MSQTGSPTSAVMNSLLNAAQEEGIISQDTRDMMCVSLNDQTLAGCAGVDVEDIESNDVTLVTVIVDETGSIAGCEQDVRQGQNEMVKSFVDSKQRDSILLGQWRLYDPKPYHSYLPVSQATLLDASNYRADAPSTPLYDRWIDAVTANVAYAQQLRAAGTPVRSICVVLTDGGDNSSTHRATDCLKLNTDLLKSEQFVLAFIGIGDAAEFNRIAKSMGIPAGSVLVAGSSASEMRRVFRLLSQSVIRASQTGNPSQAQNNFFS